MAIKFNPLTGKFDLVSKEKIVNGTTAGQLPFWNGSTWTYTETSEIFWDDTNKRLGIGTTTPTCPIDIRTLASCGITSQGGFNIDLVADPTTNPTLAFATGGSVDAGIHYYMVTFVTAVGETHSKAAPPSITTDAVNNAVQITDIPISADPRVTGRKIYRTKAGATNDAGALLATINDNTTTTYLDIKADSALTGSIYTGAYRPNTTNKFITVGGESAMVIDKNRTSIGINSCGVLAGDSFITHYGGGNLRTATSPSNVQCFGTRNLYSAKTISTMVVIGDLCCDKQEIGGYSVYIGSQVSTYNVNGSLNVGIGGNALRGTSGYSQSGCTAVGYNSGRTVTNATYSSWFGYSSGYTASQKLDVAYSTALGVNSWTDANYQMAYGNTDITQHIFRAGNLFIKVKSGATQAGAGAGADEIWKTASHATLPDNVLMIGV